jgi:branched-chain amino acid transport system ATP-binding protein
MVVIFFPFFLAEVYHLNAWGRSLALIPSVIAGIIGGVYGGGLIDRFTRRNAGKVLTLLGVYSIIFALGVLVFTLRPPLLVLIAANAAVGFGGALIGPARSVVLSNVIPPSIRTTGLQVAGLSEIPGLIFTGAIGGTLLAVYGYSAVFLFAVPFIVIDGLITMSASAFYDLDMRSATAAAMADDEWRRAKADGRGKLLVCRDVDVEYSGVQVLFGVDFDVEEGDIIALLGTNGAGKSTLLRAISGTQQASGGAIVFDGRDITHMPPHEITARGIVHMPGGRGVFPDLTVRENLTLATWLLEPDAAREGLAEVYALFPRLKERNDVEAGQLSGGEQQQLSLGQALLAKPRLLLIDELSLGLSPAVVGELLDVLREIHRRGVTIVVVEQSVNVALAIAEKAIFMEKGEVRFFGRTEDLVGRPDILRAVYVKGAGALTASGPRGAARSGRELRHIDLATARPILEVAGLTKRYGGVVAVEDVTFSLRDGEVLGLIGPNGAGKTTIFDLISGFQLPDAGIVRHEGADITFKSPEERARMGLIRRFQDAALFGSLTVFETILVSLEGHAEVKNTLLAASGAPQARRAERRLRVRAERLVELLELGSYRDKFVKELSTGLRRVVDLACVLAAEPKVLLLDEPSSGIAQAEAESLGPLLRRAQHETGCSILIIEHDMPLISAVADELIALERGTVLMRGRPEEVLDDERVIESYLGRTEATIQRSGRSSQQ